LKKEQYWKKVDSAHDQVILDCPIEVVAIYPPIKEISKKEKLAILNQQGRELKEGLEKQM